MERITIARTGQSPLVFEGEVMASSSGRQTAGQDANRWHDLSVYRTRGGHWICRVDYSTQWQGELGHTEAEQVESEDLSGWFRAYSPADHVQGFPARPEYAERQANLLAWIQRRYEQQMGELLGELGDVTAERIE